MLLTIDAGLEYQQNLAALPMAVVKLRAKSNKLVYLMPLVPQILVALVALEPCTLVTIG